MLGLVRACHPAPTAVVTLAVTALAVAWGRDAVGCVLVAAAVLAGQLSIGWSNDRIDAARDLAVGRRGKPVVDGLVATRTLTLAAGTALAVCVPLSFANGWLAGAAHLVGVAGGWAYNLGLKRTALSWLPYAVAFGLLPAFVSLGMPGEPWPPWWAVATAALLGVGAHVANVLPDIAQDIATGVRGWPQRLGSRWSRLVAPALLAVASVALVFGPDGPAGVVGWVVFGVTGGLAVAVAALPGTGALARLPFLATLVIAVVDVTLLLQRGTTVQ